MVAKAKFDTGARGTSVDPSIAAEAQIGPIVKVVNVKSASMGRKPSRRPMAKAVIEIGGKKLKALVNIQDRSIFPEKVLIGRDVIKSNFIVDVEKSNLLKVKK